MFLNIKDAYLHFFALQDESVYVFVCVCVFVCVRTTIFNAYVNQSL